MTRRYDKRLFTPGRPAPAFTLRRMARDLEDDGRLVVAGGQTTLQRGHPGPRITQRQRNPVALFELAEAMQWPTLPSGDATDSARCPWIDNCRFVLLDENPYTNDRGTYDDTTDISDVTIYCPNSFYNSSGIGVGVDHVTTGDRIWAMWSTQSGRWEDLSPPCTIWPFSLKTSLGGVAGNTAVAYLLDSAYSVPADAHEFTVTNAIGMPDAALGAGTKGLAKYMFGDWIYIGGPC